MPLPPIVRTEVALLQMKGPGWDGRKPFLTATPAARVRRQRSRHALTPTSPDVRRRRHSRATLIAPLDAERMLRGSTSTGGQIRAQNAIVAGLVLVAVPLRVARAQRDSMAARSRVRVVVARSVDRDGQRWGELKPVSGVIESFARDTLHLTIDGQTASTVIPTAGIVEIAESDGFHRHVFKGAVLGFYVGIGAAMVKVLAADPSGANSSSGAAWSAVSMGLVARRLAPIGAGLGALFGTIPHEHWRTLSPSRASGIVSPHAKGTHVGLALRF